MSITSIVKRRNRLAECAEARWNFSFLSLKVAFLFSLCCYFHLFSMFCACWHLSQVWCLFILAIILNRRQEEIARKWPPGLVLMPEAERQAALSSLQKGILAFSLFLASWWVGVVQFCILKSQFVVLDLSCQRSIKPSIQAAVFSTGGGDTKSC